MNIFCILSPTTPYHLLHWTILHSLDIFLPFHFSFLTVAYFDSPDKHLFIKDSCKCYLFWEVSSGWLPNAKWAFSSLCFMACTSVAMYITLCCDCLWTWLPKKKHSTRGRASLCICAYIYKLSNYLIYLYWALFQQGFKTIKRLYNKNKNK